MTHPNNPLSNSTPKPRPPHSDNYLCLFLVVLGLAGIYYLVYVPKQQMPTVYNLPRPVDHTPPPPPPKESRPVQVALGQLQIHGVKEVREELTFSIPGFHKKVTYSLDFGNGDTLTVTNPLIEYRYRRSGKYNVKLWGSYNGEERLLSNKAIRIDNAIEVAAEAIYDMTD